MKEYEIHTTATYSTDGGTTEGSYFVEYVTAKNMVEAKRILRAELQAAGYKNIKLYVIEDKKTACSKEVLHAVLSLYINVKHGEKALEGVLTVKAGIDQIAFFILPLGKAAVVKRLFSIFYDERYDAIVQAFLQRDQAPDSAIAVLKRMDALKVVVKSNNIIDSNYISRRIGSQQRLHTRRYIFRLRGFPTADHIGPFFIITNRKP